MPPIGELGQIGSTLRHLLSEVGVNGSIHVVDIETGNEVAHAADELVVSASVFKLPVLLELCRQYAVGLREPTERVHIGAEDYRTDGGTGVTPMLDPVEISLRDLALSMMSVSDNRATDIVCDLVGLTSINHTVSEWGFPRTVIETDCEGIADTIRADLGSDYDTIFARYMAGIWTDSDVEVMRGMRCVTPEQTNRTTPRETTELLRRLWKGELLPATASAEAIRILRAQVWPHRLKSGFPEMSIKVSGKTGTLPFVRNEVGVVEYPDGSIYAVAVFLRDSDPSLDKPRADGLIGALARHAIEALRA